MRGGLTYFRDKLIRGGLVDMRDGLIVFRDRLVKGGFPKVRHRD